MDIPVRGKYNQRHEKTQEGICSMRDVFVSYHTSSAIETVQKLVGALERAGVSCWYAPRDCEGDFAESIVHAIRGCRVFLFVMNSNSSKSEHCKNEVSQAFSRFSAHEDIAFLLFRIENCSFSDGLSYYLSRFHIMNGGVPPEELKLSELIARVKAILSMEDFRGAEVEMAVSGGHSEWKPYRLISAMQYPDTGFVGREREISEITSQLAQTDNKVILVGMGGMGKSEIAKMFLKRHAGDYDVVRWVPFAESLCRTISSDTALPIEGIRREDWPNDTDEEYAERKLHILETIADRRVLLIIDNFDVRNDPDFARLCEGACSLIFTTREHQTGSGIREIEILPMTDEEELMDLFKAEYKRGLTPEDETTVREIIALLEAHTLSIHLVASAMQARRIKPDRMLWMLRESGREIRENDRLSEIIYGRLKQVFRLTALSEEELFVLKNLALIPMSGIEVETFSDWCGADYDDIDALIEKSWIVHNPVLDRIHLHPLVADLMLEELAGDPDCCTEFLKNMVNAFTNTYQHSYSEKMQKLDYVNTVCARLPKDHPSYAMMLLTKADALVNIEGFSGSLRLYRELWDRSSRDVESIKICGKLAHALNLSGDSRGCYEIALEGWEMTKDLPADELTNEQGYWRNQVLKRLLESTRALGDYDASLRWGELALVESERFYTTTPEENRGWCLWHIARTLQMRGAYGDLERGAALTREAEQLFAKDHNDWARSYCFALQGLICTGLGEYAQALENNQTFLDMLLPRLGDDHYDIAQGYEWRGNTYQVMGDMENARACYEKAVQIFRNNGAAARQEQAEVLLNACGGTDSD